MRGSKTWPYSLNYVQIIVAYQSLSAGMSLPIHLTDLKLVKPAALAAFESSAKSYDFIICFSENLTFGSSNFDFIEISKVTSVNRVSLLKIALDSLVNSISEFSFISVLGPGGSLSTPE